MKLKIGDKITISIPDEDQSFLNKFWFGQKKVIVEAIIKCITKDLVSGFNYISVRYNNRNCPYSIPKTFTYRQLITAMRDTNPDAFTSSLNEIDL